MGTTGTITGTSKYLKEQNPDVQIIGLQPEEGASIPGIRRWPEQYIPGIYDDTYVDQVMNMGQAEAEATMRAMARQEGIFCGVSSGGTIAGALRISAQVENAIIVAIICDRGDRYLSSGVFNLETAVDR
jgi:cysteine synthase B